MSYTVALPQAEGADSVGGKGASLGELLRAGIPVPPGFAVTVGAFQAAMAAIDPDGRQRAGIEALDASDLSAIMTATAAFRDAIIAASVPDSVAAAITAAYAALGGGREDPDVAVRSSATMEDSAAASFAGLQDTYLGVRGPGEVLDRVRRCWASLYNSESVAYRRRIRLPEQSPSMAVVVQVMVRPRAAGVMFTRSPVTGDRSVVAIEGTWGLGSALVAGVVTPDSFTISKVTGEITSRRVSAKTTMHTPHPNEPGISSAEAPLHLQAAPCLADAEIRALAAVARQVEAHYGTPQDIEWAVLDSDFGDSDFGDSDAPEATRIVLLQSRPETVWAAREAAGPPPVAAPKPRAADHVLSLFGQHLGKSR
ncbi:MAG TPA: PEP/pyruvate-binding domain-containing protein [Trebonia sp.]